MSNYRILEKKGTYKSTRFVESVEGISYGDYNVVDVHREVYIPKYIVQKEDTLNHDYILPFPASWQDLREFTDLEEARRFKNDLELDEGIVRE